MSVLSCMQVRVPETGGRVLIASDGVWDAFEKMVRVSRMARRWSVEVRAFPPFFIASAFPHAPVKCGTQKRTRAGKG